MSDIQKAAKKLGCILKRSHKIDFENDEGILDVENHSAGWRCKKTGSPDAHVVVLWNGMIYDPSTGGSLWTPKQYQRYNKTKYLSILKKA